MTRVLIIADMEGVSGLELAEACAAQHPEYPAGQRRLAADINIAAREAFSLGATSVSVIDWHGGGGNLSAKMLNDGVEIVDEDLTPGYDVALLIGFHAMAGASPGFMSHTMNRGMTVAVDDVPVGELYLLSRWLGEAAIPIALVTGDRAATLESERQLSETPTLALKQATSWSRADCLPVARAHEALGQRVRQALIQRDHWCLYTASLPATVTFQLREGGAVASRLPWITGTDNERLQCHVLHMREVIDLCDVFAAIMGNQRKGKTISAFQNDPEIGGAVRTLLANEAEQAGKDYPWPR